MMNATLIATALLALSCVVMGTSYGRYTHACAFLSVWMLPESETHVTSPRCRAR